MTSPGFRGDAMRASPASCPDSNPGTMWSLGLAFISALLACILVLTATGPHGPGLTADSALYLSAARAIRGGDGFVAYNNVPFASSPPLYPLALALLPDIGRRAGLGI